MIMDAAGPEFNWDMENDLEADNDDFYRMLRDTDKPLWLGWETYIVLSTVSELLNLKIEFIMIVNYYDKMVAIVKKNANIVEVLLWRCA